MTADRNQGREETLAENPQGAYYYPVRHLRTAVGCGMGARRLPARFLEKLVGGVGGWTEEWGLV